jgi:hypothetical protein
MTRRDIAACCAGLAAAFLVLIGILHTIVGLAGLRRAIERGEIPSRFGDSHLVNWAFSGGALSLLGLLVLLVMPGLRAGSRQARRVAVAIGAYASAVGVAGYLWVPARPSVLIFLAFGALLAAPLLVWKREFRETWERGK